MDNNIKLKEIYQSLERVIKSGNIHVVLKTEEDVPDAVEGEMIIDYSYDKKAPVLKVIRNGIPEFLYTESDRLFREFIEKVFQVGSTGISNGYSPSIYFKLENDSDDSTGFTKENITAFYNDFKDNEEIRPYLKHVKTGEDVSKLYPFMDTNHVYFDISEILSGNQDVKTVSDVLVTISDEITNISDKLSDAITALSEDMDTMQSDFKKVDDTQDDLLADMLSTNSLNRADIDDLVAMINAMIKDSEKAVRPMEFTLTNPDGGNVVIPVRFKIVGGQDSGKKDSSGNAITELFMSSLYIASNDFTVVAKIGSEAMWSGGEFSTTKSNEWILTKTSDTSLYIYDVEQIDNNEFIVYMRTGNYVIFNKYIEDVIITPEYNGYNGIGVKPIDHVFNEFVNGDGYKNVPYSHRFCEGLYVTRGIGFGSGVKLIVE